MSQLQQLKYASLLGERATKIGLDVGSARASFAFRSADHLINNFDIYKGGFREGTKLAEIGEAKALIIYNVLKLQKDAISKNTRFAFPSLNALALAANCSVQWVVKVLKEIIPDVKLESGRVRGKLSWIINPFAKVREYLDLKVSERNRKIKENGDALWQKHMKSVMDRWAKNSVWVDHKTGEVKGGEPEASAKKIDWPDLDL